MSYFLKTEYDYQVGFAYLGGGVSGAVEFPDHMEDIHKEWLGYSDGPQGLVTNLSDAMNSALRSLGNPFSGFEYEDPAPILSDINSELSSYKDVVDALDAEVDYNSIVDNAVKKVDTVGVLNDVDTSGIVTALKSENEELIADAIETAVQAIESEALDNVVNAFAERQRYAKSRAVRQYTGQMADINAVQSSAFMFGIALIEAEHLQSVSDFNAQVSIDVYRDMVKAYIGRLSENLNIELRKKSIRDQILMNSINLTMQAFNSNKNFKKSLLELTTEINRIEFLIGQEYVASSADLKNKEATWPFKVFTYGGQLLGSMGGGTALPEGPSKAGSAIGGALSGAASGALSGASIGAAGGPITAVGGAAIGAGAGLAAALL